MTARPRSASTARSPYHAFSWTNRFENQSSLFSISSFRTKGLCRGNGGCYSATRIYILSRHYFPFLFLESSFHSRTHNKARVSLDVITLQREGGTWNAHISQKTSTESDMRPENVRAWAEAVEFGCAPSEQPPFDNFGNSLPNPSKLEHSFQCTGIHLNNVSRKDSDLRPSVLASLHPRLLLQSGKIYKDHQPSKIPQKRGRINFGPYIRDAQSPISRKPVPTLEDSTVSPPEAALLSKKEQVSRVGRMASYIERVRALGYPAALCPLPIREALPKRFFTRDCGGAKGAQLECDHLAKEVESNRKTPVYSGATPDPENVYVMRAVKDAITPDPSCSSNAATQAVDTDTLVHITTKAGSSLEEKLR